MQNARLQSQAVFARTKLTRQLEVFHHHNTLMDAQRIVLFRHLLCLMFLTSSHATYLLTNF